MIYIEVNENVFVLKYIEVRSYFNYEEVKYELIFEKEGIIIYKSK